VPFPPATGHELPGLSQETVREAERHAQSCGDCNSKVRKYRQLMNRTSSASVPRVAARGRECPEDETVDWDEVAAGLWPESKAAELILHAALCDHCGPQLRAAASVHNELTPEEEKFLAQLKAPSRPVPHSERNPTSPQPAPPSFWRRFLDWKILVPAVALTVMFGVLAPRPRSSPASLSGPEFAEFALNTHQRHAQGGLALEVRATSQRALNEWFKASKFSLTLPDSPLIPGEERPYHVEGALLLPAGGKTAAYIAYQMQAGLVSLIVAPDSAAVASGGAKVDFKKVSFHYRTIKGYKVVTWSQHGLTYGLVSREGNGTQQSCMVCHSAMRDRDLTHTPTPFYAGKNPNKPVL
jgi:anti-sigma factor RsiW